MPKARKHQISLDVTPYYHCVSRCVRRAYLCGIDRFTGNSYEHRRQWVEDRILKLGKIFAIDICAYAVMSNHYHVVLHINSRQNQSWSDREVCQRWHRLFKGTVLTQKFLRNEALTDAEVEAIRLKLGQWRRNLSDISWFMRLVNEPLARQANNEDNCSGKFWEARFRSQALCDEKAVPACLAYVDLNPIRARIAGTPESSDHTSIKRRINALDTRGAQPSSLAHFITDPSSPALNNLPFHLSDFLELVEWTGRAMRTDKRGYVDNTLPPLLERMEIDARQWLYLTTRFESCFKTLVGSAYSLKQATSKLGYLRAPGMKNCKAAFM